MASSIELVDAPLFAGEVADEIAQSLSDRIAESGKASLVLSGGSTPAKVYKALSIPPRVTDVDWSKVVFFWGDERWVSHDDVQSNFRMADTQLLGSIRSFGSKVCPIDTSLPTHELGADAYEKVVSEYLSSSDGKFDIVLLGIGEDGHTASLFPGSDAVNESFRLVVPAVNPADGSRRISLSSKAIFTARQILFIVSGVTKADVVKRVLEGPDEDPSVLPAILYRRASGKVTWFLDTGAASRLKKSS